MAKSGGGQTRRQEWRNLRAPPAWLHPPLKTYRIFHVDSNASLRQGPQFWREDDGAAIDQFQRLCAGAKGSELWDGGRPVAYIDGEGRPRRGLPPRAVRDTSGARS